MGAKWIEVITGPLEQKKQYRQSITRIDGLPTAYRTAAHAVHRYVLHAGGVVDGDILTTMLSDIADMFERASLDGTPIRQIIGDDPVTFAEDFVRAYGGKQWMDKERARLIQAIDDAERTQGA